jgi:hypothetical protein
MISERSIAGTAVIAGLTGAFLLLAAVAGEADELSDLRQNQQTLQQRINQLPPTETGAAAPVAARPDADGASPVLGQPGGSFPRSFLIPGTDTSIRIGGAIDATGAYAK